MIWRRVVLFRETRFAKGVGRGGVGRRLLFGLALARGYYLSDKVRFRVNPIVATPRPNPRFGARETPAPRSCPDPICQPL